MSEFQTMKAVFYEEYGDISKFQIGDRVKPTPGPKDVLIQMKAAGKNSHTYLSFFPFLF